MAVEGWMDLSRALASLVKRAEGAVVRVECRRRGPSSGVVWSADGTVVSASHGLEWEDDLEVGLASGETVAAEVAGRDPSTDLAVLKVKGSGLAPPEWRDAPPDVGELLLVVTRPGRWPKANLGLVSRLGDAWHTASGGRLDRWVELDVGLHPGFSGGLVLGLEGCALGLATAGLARGTPLAVPASTLRRVVSSILTHGGVRRGYLGVISLPVRLPPALARDSGQGSGLLLTSVEEGSPADRAALQIGDVLLQVDGRALSQAGDLLSSLEEERIGQTALVQLARGGIVQQLEVTIGARPAGGRP
jgi:S1-C subfamily serine protease